MGYLVMDISDRSVSELDNNREILTFMIIENTSYLLAHNVIEEMCYKKFSDACRDFYIPHGSIMKFNKILLDDFKKLTAPLVIYETLEDAELEVSKKILMGFKAKVVDTESDLGKTIIQTYKDLENGDCIGEFIIDCITQTPVPRDVLAELIHNTLVGTKVKYYGGGFGKQKEINYSDYFSLGDIKKFITKDFCDWKVNEDGSQTLYLSDKKKSLNKKLIYGER